MLCCWLLLIFCLTTWANDEAEIPMTLTLFNSSYSNEFGSKCLDGTNAGYYFRKSPNASTSWVIYLQGGGLCVEPIDCYARLSTNLGSSKKWANTFFDQTSVLSTLPSANPFYYFNHVYVRYCTGDTFTGVSRDGGIMGFTFAGHLGLNAIVNHLKVERNMKAATDILFTGASAGGIGVFNNANWLQSQFPSAVVKAAPNSGYFWPTNAVFYPEWLIGITYPIAPKVSQYITKFHGSRLDEHCAAANPDQPYWCWDAAKVYPYIKVDVLIANNLFDNSQLQFLAWMNDGTKNSVDFLKFYGSLVNSSVEAVRNSKKLNEAYFLPACYKHVENICVGSTQTVGPYRYADLIADWYFKRNKVPRLLLDPCWKSGSTPCNKVCENQKCGRDDFGDDAEMLAKMYTKSSSFIQKMKTMKL